MKRFALIALGFLTFMQTACNGREGPYESNQQQGVKLEDAQNRDMLHNSPLPNGSPDTPPSEISASPTGQSLGDAPVR